MMAHQKRGNAVIAFILRNVETHPRDVVRLTADHFGITRQAVYRYMRELVSTGNLSSRGNTSSREYKLPVLREETFSLPLDGLEEDTVWRVRIHPLLDGLLHDVQNIWQYCFTEMVNNAIDHSDGLELFVHLTSNAYSTKIRIHDDGIGIFRKIRDECGLEDERHAVLELAKGKLTTDPSRHTGEGIFFTSRLLDDFGILSGEVFFSHVCGKDEDWILQTERPTHGTTVVMSLANRSTRTSEEVFNAFSVDSEDYGFNKTVVPVRLLRHGAEQLVSRSQAKRLLARLDRFNIVILNFESIESIGQAFADEIFRVFDQEHPDISLIAIHTTPMVDRMIRRARHAKRSADVFSGSD